MTEDPTSFANEQSKEYFHARVDFIINVSLLIFIELLLIKSLGFENLFYVLVISLMIILYLDSTEYNREIAKIHIELDRI